MRITVYVNKRKTKQAAIKWIKTGGRWGQKCLCDCNVSVTFKSTLMEVEFRTQIKLIDFNRVDEGAERKQNLILKTPAVTGSGVLHFPSWDALSSALQAVVGAGWGRTDWPPASSQNRPAAPFTPAWRCPWTRWLCSGPSSSSLCCASSWRCVWMWWPCWVQPGSPPTTSPCLCGSPVPSPRLGARPRTPSGAASPPSPQV